MSEDKRLAQRQQTTFDARYRPYGDASYAWRPLRALNMSVSGVRFRGIDVMRLDQHLELEVMLPMQKELFSFRTRVIWSQRKSFRTIESGFKFLKTSNEDADRIAKLLEVYKAALPSK